MKWMKTNPTPEPVTPAQAKYIKDIEQSLEVLGVFFDGSTKKDASVFIDKYVNYHKDMQRIQQGKRPWWSMIANQPPKAPEIHDYFADAYAFHSRPSYLPEIEADDFYAYEWEW